MNEHGLRPSPHATPRVSTVKGVSFIAKSVAEVQARVQVPRWGERPSIKAPYLPRQKLEHIINAICRLPDVDASDLIYQISCYMPRTETSGYRFEFDLAIAVSVLSSYLQHEVPPDFAFCGEVDLGGGIRANFVPVRTHWDVELGERDEVEDEGGEHFVSKFVRDLEHRPLISPEFVEKLNNIRRIFVPEEVREDVQLYLKALGVLAEVTGIEFLQDLLPILWPDL